MEGVIGVLAAFNMVGGLGAFRKTGEDEFEFVRICGNIPHRINAGL